MRHLSTVLIFDERNEKEMRCKKLLLSFGSSAKTFLKFAMLFKYAGAVSISYSSDGSKNIKIENNAFATKVKKYAKDHVKASETGNAGSAIFIDWLKTDKNDMQCITLLKPFRGGIKDFIVDLMYEVYPLFLESDTLPQLKKNSRKSQVKTATLQNMEINTDNKHVSEVSRSDKNETGLSGKSSDIADDDDIELPDMRALVDAQLEEMNKPRRMDLSKLQ